MFPSDAEVERFRAMFDAHPYMIDVFVGWLDRAAPVFILDADNEDTP